MIFFDVPFYMLYDFARFLAEKKMSGSAATNGGEVQSWTGGLGLHSALAAAVVTRTAAESKSIQLLDISLSFNDIQPYSAKMGYFVSVVPCVVLCHDSCLHLPPWKCWSCQDGSRPSPNCEVSEMSQTRVLPNSRRNDLKILKRSQDTVQQIMIAHHNEELSSDDRASDQRSGNAWPRLVLLVFLSRSWWSQSGQRPVVLSRWNLVRNVLTCAQSSMQLAVWVVSH